MSLSAVVYIPYHDILEEVQLFILEKQDINHLIIDGVQLVPPPFR